jgi:hypothetical protein
MIHLPGWVWYCKRWSLIPKRFDHSHSVIISMIITSSRMYSISEWNINTNVVCQVHRIHHCTLHTVVSSFRPSTSAFLLHTQSASVMLTSVIGSWVRKIVQYSTQVESCLCVFRISSVFSVSLLWHYCMCDLVVVTSNSMRECSLLSFRVGNGILDIHASFSWRAASVSRQRVSHPRVHTSTCSLMSSPACILMHLLLLVLVPMM